MSRMTMDRLRLPNSAQRMMRRTISWLPPTPGSWDTSLAERLHQLESLAPVIPPAVDLSPRINVSLRDRWYVLGMTTSGKTTFTKRLIRELRHIYPQVRTYVLDSKGADDFTAWPGLVTSETPPQPLRTPGGVQVWQPPEDDVAAYGEWLERLLKARQPAIVYVDELSSLSKSQGRADYPSALAKLLKQGAKLGVCAICLTQEAAYIPRQIRTQASHIVRFRLQDDDHAADQARRLLGLPEVREPQARHGFFYRNLGTQAPAWEYDSWADFF